MTVKRLKPGCYYELSKNAQKYLYRETFQPGKVHIFLYSITERNCVPAKTSYQLWFLTPSGKKDCCYSNSPYSFYGDEMYLWSEFDV